MENENIYNICKPGFVYFVIALIILCVKTIIRFKYRPFNLVAFCSQLGSIILCTILLFGFCNYSYNIAWIITIMFILGTLTELIIAVKNWTSLNKQDNI